MADFFGGMLGVAEKKISGRQKQLDDQEKQILGDEEARKKKNESAAEGKTRLTTQDKKY